MWPPYCQSAAHAYRVQKICSDEISSQQFPFYINDLFKIINRRTIQASTLHTFCIQMKNERPFSSCNGSTAYQCSSLMHASIIEKFRKQESAHLNPINKSRFSAILSFTIGGILSIMKEKK